MPDLVSRLIVELVDRVSGNAGKTAAAVKGISAELKKLEAESKKVAGTRDLFKGFTVAQSDYARAKENINRIVRDLRNARKEVEQFNGVKVKRGDLLFEPLTAGRNKVKELERQLRSAQKEVSSTARTFREQGAAIKDAFKDLGISKLSQFIAKERELKTAVENTNKALHARGGQAGGQGGVVSTGGGRGRRGSSLTMGGTIAAAGAIAGGYGLTDAARYAYDVEFYKNKMEGRGGWARADVEAFAEYARRQAVTTGLAGGTGPAGMMAIGEVYGKAGLGQAAARGALMPTLRFARYGDIPDEEAASAIVRGATVFGLPMKTVADAEKSSTRIADVMSYAANKTIADVGDIAQAFKYAAPMANALGMSPEQLASYVGTMVQHGNRGDEAGIAMRSALVRSVKPTIDSAQAMAELGLDFGDFAKERRVFTADEAVSGMRARFGKMKPGAEKRLQGVLDANPEADSATLARLLNNFFIPEVGAQGAQDKEKVANAVRKFLSSQVENIDFEALFAALGDKGATVGHMARIFDQRQAARLLPLLHSPEYERLMSGMQTDAPGAAKRGAQLMMQGFIGDWSKFVASVQDLILATSDSGALRSAAETIRELASAVRMINSLSNAKPADGSYSWADYVNGKAAGDAGAATRELALRHPGNPFSMPIVGANVLTNYVKGKISGPPSAAPMGAAMGAFEIKADGKQAKTEIDGVKDGIMNLDGMTAVPKIQIAGFDLAMEMIGRLRSALSSLSAESRGVHADIGATGGTGW